MPLRGNKVRIPQIDREAVLDKEFDELSDVEKRWLQDTDYWPADAEEHRQPVTFRMPDGSEVSNDPVWLMMQGQQADLVNNPMLRKLIEEKAQELVAQRMAEITGQPTNLGIETETTQGQAPGPRQGPAFSELEIPENVNPEDDEDDEGTGDDDQVPYDLMGIHELRNEAVKRNPKISIAGDAGKKDPLIKALNAWDEEHGGRPKLAE